MDHRFGHRSSPWRPRRWGWRRRPTTTLRRANVKNHKRVLNYGVKHRELQPPTNLLADKSTVILKGNTFIRSSDDGFYTAKQATAPTDSGAVGWKSGDQLITPTMCLFSDLDKWNPGIFMAGPGAKGRTREFLGTAVSSNPTPLTYNGRTWYMNDKWYTEGRIMWLKMEIDINFSATTVDSTDQDKVIFFCRATDHDPADANYWFNVDADRYPNSDVATQRAAGTLAMNETNIYTTNTHIGEWTVQSQQNIMRGLNEDHSFYRQISTLKRGFKVKMFIPIGKHQRHLEKTVKTYKFNRDQENLGSANSPNIYLMCGFMPMESQKATANAFNWTMSVKTEAKVRMYHPPTAEIERIKAARDGATQFHPMPGENRPSDQNPSGPTPSEFPPGPP